MRGRWLTRCVAALVAVSLVAAGCSDDDDHERAGSTGDAASDGDPTTTVTRPRPTEPVHHGSFDAVLPRPAAVEPAAGELALVPTTSVVVDDAAADTAAGAPDLLRGYLQPATGLELPVAESAEDARPGPTIVFSAPDEGADLGDEGYELTVDPDRVQVKAAAAAGFGWAVQTLRQMLPAEIDSGTAQPGTFTLPAGTVRDHPRYAWRGVMLDVARHFFPPEDVERVIDLAAQYKLNRLHLHLSDDQGWRIQIDAYPALTEVGAATETGGGPGGFYTKDQYRSLVDYAAARGITIVPEIEMPGHSSAALAAVPSLTCPGVAAPPIATGFSPGTSELCPGEESTYDFVETVVGELAEMTPGPYIHIGADEAQETTPDELRHFVGRAVEIVRAAGKQPIGWEEIATVEPGPDALVQFWSSGDPAVAAAAGGTGVIMSYARRCYMDMKYDASTPTGLTWAGMINTRFAYEWDPNTLVPGLPLDRIVGVEAPLWTETVTNLAEVEQMMLPRLPGYAEIGWSPPDGRTWDEYQPRLARQAPRWTAAGRAYTQDPVVNWAA
jgi:hexosaminidase